MLKDFFSVVNTEAVFEALPNKNSVFIQYIRKSFWIYFFSLEAFPEIS